MPNASASPRAALDFRWPRAFGRGTSGADKHLFAKGGAVADGVAPLPGPVGQAAGKGFVAAQPARSQHVTDIVGETADLAFHKFSDRCHQRLEPFSPVGFRELIDADPKRIF